MTKPISRRAQAVTAGEKLRQMRTDREWTAMDVEKKTRQLSLDWFGEDRSINETQNGRIERGNIDRVSFENAMLLARVYGMTPQQMAVLFGLWPDYDEEAKLPRELQAAVTLYHTLEDEEERARFLWRISYDTAGVTAERRWRAAKPTPKTQSDWGKYRSREKDEE